MNGIKDYAKRAARKFMGGNPMASEPKELALVEPAAQVPALTPYDMIKIAVEKGTDLAQLSKLMDMKDRWEANEARKAYNEAFTAFKAEAVEILKTIAVTDGPLKGKKYADLFAAIDVITPALSKHGLSHSWKPTKDERDWLEVTCTIRHVLGHTESVALGGPPDTTGSKNAIQARGSTLSYLERYSLLAATGLAAKNQDDDGGTGETISAEQKEELVALIKETKADTAAFLAFFGAPSIDEILVGKFAEAKMMLETKKKRAAQ